MHLHRSYTASNLHNTFSLSHECSLLYRLGLLQLDTTSPGVTGAQPDVQPSDRRTRRHGADHYPQSYAASNSRTRWISAIGQCADRRRSRRKPSPSSAAHSHIPISTSPPGCPHRGNSNLRKPDATDARYSWHCTNSASRPLQPSTPAVRAAGAGSRRPSGGRPRGRCGCGGSGGGCGCGCGDGSCRGHDQARVRAADASLESAFRPGVSPTTGRDQGHQAAGAGCCR